MIDPEAADHAADEYLNQPANWGPDDDDTRAAERDAFLAGWNAREDHAP